MILSATASLTWLLRLNCFDMADIRSGWSCEKVSR
jgi:hypothetical protein